LGSHEPSKGACRQCPDCEGFVDARWNRHNVQLRTTDILWWIYLNRPDRFTVKDIMNEYSLSQGEANRRVVTYIVNQWQAASCIGEERTNKPGRNVKVYGLTDWGRTWGEAQKEKRK
jgi:hypothetical protein